MCPVVSAWMQGTLFSGFNVVADWRMFPLHPGNLTVFPGVRRTEREPHHML